ncbi:MAG TPA: hypothetical protein VH165_00930 [Kofleriaceae bacterium]|jgi:hypothetical protein|nr:hypothetical protein [Kofleriaceae bacterium]
MKRLILFAALLSSAACAHQVTYVAGTKVPFSTMNKSVLDTCEEYRLAVERGDADALMLMAHKQYWEDSGTPSGSDDYGIEGLRNVLLTRLQKASDIRYSMRYVNVHQQCTDLKPGCRAAVDVLIDASFTIANAIGRPIRPDKRDQNQLVLEWDGHRWLFLSGM